jgi:hypothetical protein
MVEPVIRVVIALLDLIHWIRLKSIAKALDLRTTILTCIAHTGREVDRTGGPPLNVCGRVACGAY